MIQRAVQVMIKCHYILWSLAWWIISIWCYNACMIGELDLELGSLTLTDSNHAFFPPRKVKGSDSKLQFKTWSAHPSIIAVYYLWKGLKIIERGCRKTLKPELSCSFSACKWPVFNTSKIAKTGHLDFFDSLNVAHYRLAHTPTTWGAWFSNKFCLLSGRHPDSFSTFPVLL